MIDDLDLLGVMFRDLVRVFINFFFNWKLSDVIELEELIKIIILVIMFLGFGVLKEK